MTQLVGADEAEHGVVDAHAFLEGLCAECLEEHEDTKVVTLEDIAHTEEEALNLVSLVKKRPCAVVKTSSPLSFYFSPKQADVIMGLWTNLDVIGLMLR